MIDSAFSSKFRLLTIVIVITGTAIAMAGRAHAQLPALIKIRKPNTFGEELQNIDIRESNTSADANRENWGLVDERTMPARIPSVNSAVQREVQPVNLYEHSIEIGNYKPERNEYVDLNQPPMPYRAEVPLEKRQTNFPLVKTREEAAYSATPFHVKEKHPSVGELLSTSAYFFSYQIQALQPYFQANSALTFENPRSGSSSIFDWDFEDAHEFHFGIEASHGPGFLISYNEFNNDSDLISATSDGFTSVSAAAWLVGPQRLSKLTASNVGETITAQHGLEFSSWQALAFKEIKMPVSRLNGIIGMRYLDISQQMRATLQDGSGNTTGILTSITGFHGIGPTMGAEYFRPIGHTKLEFVGGAKVGVFFGERSQYAWNTRDLDFSTFGTYELVTNLETKVGAQWVREWGRKYRVFVRGQLVSQAWLGGGTSVDPNSDFGLYGFTLQAGLNH